MTADPLTYIPTKISKMNITSQATDFFGNQGKQISDLVKGNAAPSNGFQQYGCCSIAQAQYTFTPRYRKSFSDALESDSKVFRK